MIFGRLLVIVFWCVSKCNTHNTQIITPIYFAPKNKLFHKEERGRGVTQKASGSNMHLLELGNYSTRRREVGGLHRKHRAGSNMHLPELR